MDAANFCVLPLFCCFFLADRVAISDETTVGVAVSEFSRPLPHELRIRWSLMDGMWPVMGLDDSGFFRKKKTCVTLQWYAYVYHMYPFFFQGNI